MSFTNSRNFGNFLISFRKFDLKATDVTLFWNLARNLENFHQKFAEKNAKFEEEIEKNREFNHSIAKTIWRFLTKKMRLENGAKECIV